MITAGIDSGAKNVKVVILNEGEVVGRARMPTGLEVKASINAAYEMALGRARIARAEVRRILITGFGKKECDFADGEVTEVGAVAKAVHYHMPQVRTIISVGAETASAIRINEKGNAVDFAVNDKCAAGTGAFIEATARALETRVEKMGELYDMSTKTVAISAQCAVFAESEIVSLVHSQAAMPDIARAVLIAIAERVASIVRKVGIENDLAAIGGVALNKGFIKAVEKTLNVKIFVPAEPNFVGALGAAIAAAE